MEVIRARREKSTRTRPTVKNQSVSRTMESEKCRLREMCEWSEITHIPESVDTTGMTPKLVNNVKVADPFLRTVDSTNIA